jgi:futalosine hydrolase
VPERVLEAPGSILWAAATKAELAGLPQEAWSVVTGCGPAAAAAGLALALAAGTPDRIVGVGIAGAYPSSPFRPPQVVRVDEDAFVDLGAESPSGFLDLWSLGVPDPGVDRRYLSEVPAFLSSLPSARGATCSTCTGTLATQRLRESAGAQIETMEGAAWALVASRCSVPFHQVRAISNTAGPRDRRGWKVPEALSALSTFLESLRK